MPNKNYIKGRKKEQKIVKECRDKGLIAFRSAGSKSPIDVCVIHKAAKRIYFLQCKPDSMSESAKKKLEDEQVELNSTYIVEFKVV